MKSELPGRFDGSSFRETWRDLYEASNLPGFCYTSPEWYEREITQIFLKEWLCVGRVEDVGQIGDYFVTKIAGERLAIIRDQESQLRAILPICRHRGAMLLTDSDSGNCKKIVCPYHAWTYRPSGELIATPGRHRPMEDLVGFDRRDYGLMSIRLETWGGFIFVNFDREAMPLMEWLGDLPSRLASYGMESLRRTHTISYDVDCNWKTYVDNASDEYHVEFLHRKHVRAPNFNEHPLENMVSGGPYEGWVNPYYNSTSRPGTLPTIAGLDETQRKNAYQFHIRPYLYIVATATCVKYAVRVPESVGKTRTSMSWCFPEDTIARPDFAEVASREDVERTRAVVEEDVWISQKVVQGGLASRFRPIGRYSRREATLHSFHKYILDRVLAGTEKAVSQAKPKTDNLKQEAFS